MKLIYKIKQLVLVGIVKLYKMRKDDWITKLYYKNLSEYTRYNNNTGKDVSSKKKTPPKTIKPKRK